MKRSIFARWALALTLASGCGGLPTTEEGAGTAVQAAGGACPGLPMLGSVPLGSTVATAGQILAMDHDNDPQGALAREVLTARSLQALGAATDNPMEARLQELLIDADAIFRTAAEGRFPATTTTPMLAGPALGTAAGLAQLNGLMGCPSPIWSSPLFSLTRNQDVTINRKLVINGNEVEPNGLFGFFPFVGMGLWGAGMGFTGLFPFFP
jgi:hypothetical protein